MSGNYKEHCMKFSNEELKKYMIDYLINHSWKRELIRCFSEDDDELEINSPEKIFVIVLDGEKEDLSIHFYGVHTSIFVHNEELMFIDEDSKGIYTSSDVQGNAVYEGKLREMTHEQMLQMFCEIVLCFADSVDVSITELPDSENKYGRYNYYKPKIFIIDVKNDRTVHQTKIYENITINY